MTTRSTKRIALVGYGRHAPKHLEVLRALGAEVVAACNRSEAGRQRAHSEGQIPHTYATLAEMMESQQPDGVICCASIMQVYAVTRELIPFGVPLLVEKPPGTSLQEFDELKAEAIRYLTPVMVGLNRRYYSILDRAVADAGGLAAITQVSVDWSEDPRAMLTRGFSASDVARMIFGYSLHGLDLLAYLAGELADPQLATRNLGEPFRWVMAVQGISQRGTVASFNSTWDSPGRWRVQFCSPGKRYVFAPLETCLVQQTGVKTDRVIEASAEDQKFKAGFYTQAQAFLDMVETRKVPDLASLHAASGGMCLAQRLTDSLLGHDSPGDES